MRDSFMPMPVIICIGGNVSRYTLIGVQRIATVSIYSYNFIEVIYVVIA